jgi:16S rRNA (guanine527-N7)-methyltransferase
VKPEDIGPGPVGPSDWQVPHAADVPDPDVHRPIFGADDTIDRYVDMLTGRGVAWGLLGPREAPRIWERHIWNCAVVAPSLRRAERICDVGSGAGLPGLVLAIARRDLTVTLLEPMARRVEFLTDAVALLELSHVTVVRGRAEEPAVQLHSGFDVITARAVAPLGKLIGWCAPLVRSGGRLLFIKGTTADDEVAGAQEQIETLGAAAVIEEHGLGIVEPPTRVIRIEFASESA